MKRLYSVFLGTSIYAFSASALVVHTDPFGRPIAVPNVPGTAVGTCYVGRAVPPAALPVQYRPPNPLVPIAFNSATNTETSRPAEKEPEQPKGLNTAVVSNDMVPNPENYPLTREEFYLVQVTNEFRKEKGLPPLAVSPRLMDESRKHAEGNPGGRLVHSRFGGRENVVHGGINVQVAIDQWIGSSAHNANMRAAQKWIGVAIQSNFAIQRFE